MAIEQVRSAREANPFRPFTIHLANGRSLRVPHRDDLVTELAIDDESAAEAGDAA